MRKYATFLALLVLLSPLPASAENYPDTLGLSLSELQKRTGNLKCSESINPMSEGLSWSCEYKFYSWLNVNEEYVLDDNGKVSTVIVSTRDMPAEEAVKAYLEEHVWAIRFYGEPRRTIRSQTARPQYLVREVAKGNFVEVAIWHIGKDNFLLLFLTGDEGAVTVTWFYAPKEIAVYILGKMTDVEDPYQILLPDKHH